MSNKDLYFFNDEILGEGSLYITYIHLKDNYGWDINKYRDIIYEYYEKNILTIYKYGDKEKKENEFIDIYVYDINFDDIESLKQYSFSRGKNWTWDNLNKYYENE